MSNETGQELLCKVMLPKSDEQLFAPALTAEDLGDVIRAMIEHDSVTHERRLELIRKVSIAHLATPIEPMKPSALLMLTAIVRLEPDWDVAPEWANYAVPSIWWNSLDGAVLRYYFYEEMPLWNGESWEWASGAWGFAEPDDGVKLLHLFCGHDSVRQRHRPGGL